MGNILRTALRPMKNFNIENRALKVISKDKPTPAPKYEIDKIELEKLLKANPSIVNELSKKDSSLDGRLKNVYVSSKDIMPQGYIPPVPDPSKPLPLSRKFVPFFDYGLKEPDVIPEGYITLRQTFEIVNGYNYEPDKFTTTYITNEYQLKHETVCNILHYFKTFSLYMPKKDDKKGYVKQIATTTNLKLEQAKQ